MEDGVAQKIDSFFTQYKQQTFRKGEILLRADDDPLGIYYLKAGTVKMYGISRKGDELVLNIYKPVSFFPMAWAINNAENKYYYEALTDVEGWRAPKDKTIQFIKSNPDVLYDLVSRIYRGVEGVLMRMNYLMAGSAHSRLINEIFIQAKRFGKKNKETGVELSMSEKDLAALAGMTRETVSREMKTLKDKGLVLIEKNSITITNMDQLEEELSATL